MNHNQYIDLLVEGKRILYRSVIHPEKDIDITAEIKKLRDKYHKEGRCNRFGDGQCNEIADDLIEISGGELWETTGEDRPDVPQHAWVKYKGKYYDARDPEGVTDWKQLSLFKLALGKDK